MIANLISLSRLAMAAAFVHYADNPVIAVGILSAAGISDWMDGWLARKLGKTSRFGALLDPICDRLFILPVLATLVLVHDLPPWQLAVLVTRDVTNSLGAGILWLLRREEVPKLRARISGKVVTSLQFWSVVHIVLGLPYFTVSFTAVALATAWALVDYGRQFFGLLGVSKSVSTP